MLRPKGNQNIYVGLGSNLGDRAGNLLLALRGILNAGLPIIRCSSVYETEPISDNPQPTFLNMVAELNGTSAPPADKLLARLLRVEYALGRSQNARMGPRTIDLDLLLYKDEISETEFLILPHPRLHQRRFVLVPLVEIAPNLVHPILKEKMATLLAQTKDRSPVTLWKP